MPDPTWDLTDQDCSALDGGWTQTGSSAISLVTEDGRDCYKLTANLDFVFNNSTVAWTSNCTFQCVFKMLWATYPTISGSDFNGFFFFARDSNQFDYNVEIGADPSFFSESTHAPMIITRTVSAGPTALRSRGKCHYAQDTWHTLRCVVEDDYLFVWLDGYLYAHKQGPSSNLGAGSNIVGIDAFKQGASASLELYIDSIQMSSTPMHPDPPGGLKIEDGNVASRAMQPSKPDSTYLPVQKLRYQRSGLAIGDLTMEIPLVDTTDDYASPVRIYDGSATKSLLKYPTF